MDVPRGTVVAVYKRDCFVTVGGLQPSSSPRLSPFNFLNHGVSNRQQSRRIDSATLQEPD